MNWESWTDASDDDRIDELVSQVLAVPPDPAAAPVIMKALSAATSDLTVRSVVTALAYVTPDDDSQAVERIEEAFDSHKGNVFLGPSILGALVLLALRNAAARTGAIRYLLRLKPDDPRPLLVAGLKAIGLLCDREDAPALRSKLSALAGSDDVAVKAEGRHQIALLRLADAFLATTHSTLVASLAAAKESFKLAETSEEIRPDAKLLRLLLDAILHFDSFEQDRAGAAAKVAEIVGELRQMGGRLAEQIFRMDRSPAASQLASQCATIASALETAAGEVAQATRWTNYDTSVVRLAECYGIVRYCPDALIGNEQAFLATSRVAERILKPRLGPVLARKVGRDSFEQVILNYESRQGHDEVVAGLRALQQASLESERVEGYQLSEETVGLLAGMADKADCTPDELVRRFNLKIGTNDGGLTFEPLTPIRGTKMMLATIGLVVALPEEFDAMRVMISNERRYRAEGPGGGREYLLGDIPSVRKGIHHVVIAQTMDMGNTSAASRTTKMLMDFEGLDAIIMCGIAGGVSNAEDPQEHVRLGDIVVSNRIGVVQYDFGKQKGKVFEDRHAPRPPSARLLEAVLMLEQDKLSGQRPWDAHLRNGLSVRSLARPDASTDVILDSRGEKIDHPTVVGESPRVFLSPIASANVVQGDFKKRDILRDRYKVKAVEMEGYGIADATWEYEKGGYLVVRGICDYCDVRTKHFQTDPWKRYAAMAAAAYVRALIEAMPGEEVAPTTG